MIQSALKVALDKEEVFLCGIVEKGGSLSADDVCDALDRIQASVTEPTMPDRQRLADMFSQMRKDGKSWLQIADATRAAMSPASQGGAA